MSCNERTARASHERLVQRMLVRGVVETAREQVGVGLHSKFPSANSFEC